LKVNILYNFRSGPWGGGNQFLKALKQEFIRMRVYENRPEKAEAIIFNSYPSRSEYLFNLIFKLKQKDPQKVIIYRLDGPIFLIRGKDMLIDRIVRLFADLFVDGIIFQSEWCKIQNKKLFGISAPYETVILNASDNKIFSKVNKKTFYQKQKVKLISISWSSNWRKGFKIYKFLDENLNFSKYEMTFVGNSPVEFKNIKWLRPVPSTILAEILRKHDIFITASQSDPCSNALIEALSCGLPVVAFKDGGHPELIQGGGELFKGEDDILEKIERVVENYNVYQSQIPEFSIKNTAQNYYQFIEKIYIDVKNAKYRPKRMISSTKIGFYKMNFMILKWKLQNKIQSFTRWV